MVAPTIQPSELVEIAEFSQFEALAERMKFYAAENPLTTENAGQPQIGASKRIAYKGNMFTIVYTESPDDLQERHFSVSANVPPPLAFKIADLFMPGEKQVHKGVFMPVIHFRQKM